VPASASYDDRLVRDIGPWALVAFALNLTVGAGILGLPARLQGLVGNYSIAIIVACGLLIALVALCFAEVGSRFDRTGGPQLYASIALGPGVGFTVGWLLWISRVGTCAAVSNVLVDYATVLAPVAGQPLTRASIITALVLAYTWINIRGIRQTAAVSTAFTVAKLIPLGVLAIAGLTLVRPERLHLGAVPSATDLATALLLAAFAYFGFDGTTVLAGEVRDPRRSVPFAIVVSVLIVMLLYSLIQLVCVGALPNLVASERPIADAATMLLGSWASVLVAATAVVACAGVFGASLTPGTRLLFAMAERNQLPSGLRRVYARYHTPVVAILVTAAVALAFAISNSFIYLVKITLICRVSVYAVTCLTLPLFRRRKDVPPAAFQLPAGTAVACSCALACVLFLAKGSMREMLDVALGVLIGLMLFALTQFRRHRPGATSRAR